ncbi:MAG: alpha/beta hydrolase [Chitinivibrionales bacterium]
MQSKWLVFGGWSLPPDILSPVFSNEATYVDVNKLFLDIIAEKCLKDTWVEIISDKTAHLIAKAPVCIAGWSTGAFLAYALSTIIKPQKMILLSASPSFCKRAGFVHGQDSAVIKVMRRQLTRNKLSVLENFQKQCGLDQYIRLAENYSAEELTSGLHFLEKINLLPLKKPLCPTLLFHGKEDAIIPSKAGEFFARETGAAKTILPGGHVFFLDDSNALLIRNAVDHA